MPIGISTQTHAPQTLATQQAENILREQAQQPVEISDETLLLIVSTLASAALTNRAGTEQSQAKTPVHLRAPEYAPEQAAGLFLVSLAKVAQLLAAHNGQRDPVASEEGGAQRVSEGVTVATPPRSETPQTVLQTPASAPEVDGTPSSFGYYLTTSNIVNLMVALRSLIMQMERENIEQAGRMREIQRDTAIIGARKGVEAAEVAIMAAAVGALAGGGFGLATLQQQTKFTKMQTDSVKLNQNRAQLSSQNVHDLHAAGKSSTAATADIRPARDIDGNPVAQTPGVQRPSAQVQADVDANQSPTRAVDLDDIDRPIARVNQNLHDESNIVAQRYMHRAMMLQVAGPGVSATASASFGVEEKTLLGQQEVLRTDVQNHAATASESEDQLRSDRSLRDSAMRVTETLMELQANASNSIIGNM